MPVTALKQYLDAKNVKYVSITRQLMTYMAQDPKSIPRILNILWAARALERMGDRCGNIAEYIFYLVHGRDIRHIEVDDAVIFLVGRETSVPVAEPLQRLLCWDHSPLTSSL